MRYHFTPTGMAIRKNIKTSVSKDMGKLEPSYVIGGYVKCCSKCKSSLNAPQTVKHRLLYDLPILRLDIAPR